MDTRSEVSSKQEAAVTRPNIGERDMQLNRRGLLAGGLLLAAGCSTKPTLAQTSGEPLVETAQGRLRGIVQPNGVVAFKGMRYGAAASGPLRFMPPAPPPKWAGI